MKLKNLWKYSNKLEQYFQLSEIKDLIIEQIWIKFDHKISPIERNFKNQLLGRFTQIQKEVIKNYKQYELIKYDRQNNVQKLKNIYHEHLRQGIKYGIKRANVESEKLRKSFDELSLRYFNEIGLDKLINKVDGNTYKKLLEILKQAIKDGLSIDDTVKLITTEFDKFKKNYAEVIARTEIARASNWAYLEQMKTIGFTAKKYITALDERVCPICAPLNNTIIDIDEEFIGQYKLKTKDVAYTYKAKYPPLHPNCRCTIVSIPLEQDRQLRNAKITIDDLPNIQGFDDIVLQSIQETLNKINKTDVKVSNWFKGHLKDIDIVRAGYDDVFNIEYYVKVERKKGRKYVFELIAPKNQFSIHALTNNPIVIDAFAHPIAIKTFFKKSWDTKDYFREKLFDEFSREFKVDKKKLQYFFHLYAFDSNIVVNPDLKHIYTLGRQAWISEARKWLKEHNIDIPLEDLQYLFHMSDFVFKSLTDKLKFGKIKFIDDRLNNVANNFLNEIIGRDDLLVDDNTQDPFAYIKKKRKRKKKSKPTIIPKTEISIVESVDINTFNKQVLERIYKKDIRKEFSRNVLMNEENKEFLYSIQTWQGNEFLYITKFWDKPDDLMTMLEESLQTIPSYKELMNKIKNMMNEYDYDGLKELFEKIDKKYDFVMYAKPYLAIKKLKQLPIVFKPNYEGILYRGIENEEFKNIFGFEYIKDKVKLEEKLKELIGKEADWKDWMKLKATTKDKEIAQWFGRVVLKFRNVKGYDISNLPDAWNEKEVLIFSPYNKFKIVDVYEDLDLKKIVIELENIE